MADTFTYSILQYKHSPLLRESVNVGVLFYFPEENRLEFVSGNSYRIKAIYLDFDLHSYTYLIKHIHNVIKKYSNSIFQETELRQGFKAFIKNTFLPEDSSCLQFAEPTNSLKTSKDIGKIVKQYSQLLLPGIDIKKEEVIKHNESFIIKRYSHYLFENHKHLNNVIERDKIVQHNEVKFKFDFAWQNGTHNLVKPISFDLKEESDIQSKSATYFGYFTLLKDYGIQHNARFDILVASPKEQSLKKAYYKAIDVLNKVEGKTRIIREDELKDYSTETISNLEKL